MEEPVRVRRLDRDGHRRAGHGRLRRGRGERGAALAGSPGSAQRNTTRRKFPRQFVEFVDTPYRRPAVGADEQITPRERGAGSPANARAARNRPACVTARRTSTSPACCGAWRPGTSPVRRASCTWPARSAGCAGPRARPGSSASATVTGAALPGSRCASPSCCAGLPEPHRCDSGLRPSAQDAPLSATFQQKCLRRACRRARREPGRVDLRRLPGVGRLPGGRAGFSRPSYGRVGRGAGRTGGRAGPGRSLFRRLQPAPARFAVRTGGTPYAAWHLASDEWAEQVDGLAKDGKLIVAAPGTDALPPAAAVAAGRAAAFAIDAYLQRSDPRTSD